MDRWVNGQLPLVKTSKTDYIDPYAAHLDRKAENSLHTTQEKILVDRCENK